MSDTCKWTEDSDGNWATGCDNLHCFMTGGVEENDYEYCPYCGLLIDAEDFDPACFDEEFGL